MLFKDPKLQIQRARDKQRLLLDWVSDQVWVSTETSAELLGIGRPAAHAALAALQRNSCLVTDRIWVKGRQRTVWGITPHGLAMADKDPTSPAYERDRVSSDGFEHAELIQKSRLKAIRAGWTKWAPGSHYKKQALPKVPDAVGTTPTGLKVAIEVEREIKTRKRYADIISCYLQLIRAGIFDRVAYITPDGLEARLRRVFDSIKEVPVAGQRVRLEEKHRARFSFSNLVQWPGGANDTLRVD